MGRNRGSADNITADNVIVLSFRNLQLDRIGALQDKLIELSLRGERTNRKDEEQTNRKDDEQTNREDDEHTNRVDEALRAYGE